MMHFEDYYSAKRYVDFMKIADSLDTPELKAAARAFNDVLGERYIDMENQKDE